MRGRYTLIGAGIICFGVFLVWGLQRGGMISSFFFTKESPMHGPMYAQGTDAPQSLLFVGDVMLARQVETLMRKRGTFYPFSFIHEYLVTNTFVFGNFEAAMPEIHTQTPLMTFSFSVAEDMVSSLKDNGFTHLTLANNHAYDYGYAGHRHALETLRKAGIAAQGSPSPITVDDIAYIAIDGLRVAVLPLYAVSVDPSLETVRRVLAEASKRSDIQIVSIHWGEEYKKENTSRQQGLAHALVDMGVDAIIGHHPHVVENIELYKNVPIFYSLGNFIFDQYWNDDVKTGLMIRIEYHAPYLYYSLVPIYDAESAPVLLSGESQGAVLSNLSAISDVALAEGIKMGAFKLELISQ